MSRQKKSINLVRNEGQKTLDFSINVSHNRPLSDRGLIQLVKLLARQAAKEDYMQSILHSDQGGDR